MELFSFDRIWASIIRNVSAEWPFYLQLGSVLCIGFSADVLRRRDVVRRYLSPGFRTDLLYTLIELSHLQHLFILLPLTILLTGLLRQWAPWLQVTSLTSLPDWGQFLVTFVVADFVAYWYHRAQHASPWLWQLHKVHHSQRDMTALTTFRKPILDRVVEKFFLVPPALAIASDASVPLAILAFIWLRDTLQHADLGWTFGRLGKIIVSPGFHEVHHSSNPQHIDKNFAPTLALWDYLFGTAVEREPGPLTYGLVEEELPESYGRQMWIPALGIWQLFKTRLGAHTGKSLIDVS